MIQVPSWIVRRGAATILSCAIVLLLSSWFIRYPDIIPARIIITIRTPPLNVVANSKGKITLFKEEGSRVDKGDILGVIKNSAYVKDILYLDSVLSLSKRTGEAYINQSLNLEEVQKSYQQYLSSKSDYEIFDSSKKYDIKISNTYTLLIEHKKLDEFLNNQLNSLVAELDIVHEEVIVDSILYANQMIAKAKINETYLGYLSKRRGGESNKKNCQ